MRPAFEAGYESHCQAQDGPWPEDEDTAEADADFASLVASMFDAADGGEGDPMEPEITAEAFNKQIKSLTPLSLVAMRNAIDGELKTRREMLAKELAATEHALNGTRPRARRSDAGKPREKKDGVAA